MSAPAMMDLALAHALLPGSRLVGDGALPVTRVHSDTRTLRPGDLFVALRGERFDAHDFLAQARAAGAVAAINGLNVIAAPLFVLLYQVVKPGPYLMNVAILLGMLIYVLKEPLLRNAGLKPTTEQETAKSVERNDGSGGF